MEEVDLSKRIDELCAVYAPDLLIEDIRKSLQEINKGLEETISRRKEGERQAREEQISRVHKEYRKVREIEQYNLILRAVKVSKAESRLGVGDALLVLGLAALCVL